MPYTTGDATIAAAALALALVAAGAWWTFSGSRSSPRADGASTLGPDFGGFSGRPSVTMSPSTTDGGSTTTSAKTGGTSSTGTTGGTVSGTGNGGGSGGSGGPGTTGTTGSRRHDRSRGGTGHGSGTGHGRDRDHHSRPGGTGTTGGTGGTGGSRPSPSPSPSSTGSGSGGVAVGVTAGSGSGGTTVDAGATLNGPGGAMTSLHVTACTVGLSGISAKASVGFSNGYTASNVALLGLSLKNLSHPLGLHVNVGGSSYSVPLGVSVSVSLCL